MCYNGEQLNMIGKLLGYDITISLFIGVGVLDHLWILSPGKLT